MNKAYQIESTKYGLLAGLVTIAYMVFFYFIDKKLMLSAGVYWSSLLIPIIFMLLLLLKERQKNLGLISFRQALQQAFIVYLVADILFYLFYYLLYNVFDPEMESVARQLTLDALAHARESGMERIGDQSIENLVETAENQYFGVSLLSLLPKFAYGVIGGFILSLILAVLLRRES